MHGLTQNVTNLQNVYENIVNRTGYAVLAPEYRGFGKIAEKMAVIMQEMGNNNRQVISITHLPQIAAMGSTHYKVSKEETPEGTVSHMQLLNNDERVREIAQMLSGSDISQAAINNAQELLRPVLNKK